MVRYHEPTRGKIHCTAEEEAARDQEEKPFEINLPKEKIDRIRKIRNEKLAETDFYALGDQTMSDAMKTYRKNLRDITTNYSQSDYDALLNRESDKTDPNYAQLTHTVWSKP